MGSIQHLDLRHLLPGKIKKHHPLEKKGGKVLLIQVLLLTEAEPQSR